MIKTFKYRLYPTKKQIGLLTAQLAEGCRLYNAALQERREAYRMTGKSINYYDQSNQLKEIRAAGDSGLANFCCSQDILRRLDKNFKAFFARIKQGKKAGFPRFKPIRRFDSITFPSYGDGCKFLSEIRRLRIQGVGHIKVKLHRSLQGTIKTVTIKREAGRWYVCFSVEYNKAPLPALSTRIGIDVGLVAFATFSDGSQIQNPRYYQAAQAKLRVAQRRVARRKKGSNRRRKAVQILQRINTHIANQRADFHHKESRKIVHAYGMIAVEDLNVKGLATGMLAKPIQDAGWSSFLNKLAYKAEEAGRVLAKVNPNGTSQACSGCGCLPNVPKTLADRVHCCPHCGLTLDRDVNAAHNILRLGLSLWTPTWDTGPCVVQEAVCFS